MKKKLVAAVLTLVICSGARARNETPVFYWDMETENATICKDGSDHTPTYYTNRVQRTDTEAYAGKMSLRTKGAWASATFDNNSDETVWAPVTEGTIEFYWQYHAPWGDQMLFQMTGKSSTKDKRYDTNDGVGLRTRAQNPGEFFSGGARNRYHPIPLEEGRWYRFRVRYKQDRGISLQIDDGPQYLSEKKTFGPTQCKAWHQILIGNDRKSDVSQNIDNFAVYDHWLPDDPPDPRP